MSFMMTIGGQTINANVFEKRLETSRKQLSRTNSDKTPLHFYDLNKQDKRTKRHLL